MVLYMSIAMTMNPEAPKYCSIPTHTYLTPSASIDTYAQCDGRVFRVCLCPVSAVFELFTILKTVDRADVTYERARNAANRTALWSLSDYIHANISHNNEWMGGGGQSGGVKPISYTTIYY